MRRGWKKLSSKYVYKNPWIKVREDQVIKPDGNPGIYGVIEQHNGVCIIPVDKDGKIWMVKIYRYIFDDEHWELVAGDVEPSEDSQAAARRELIEELEMDAKLWNQIGTFRPSNGRIGMYSTVFVAKNLKPKKEKKEDWDVRAKEAFSLEEIDAMIRRGEIVDGYVMNALYFYKLYLEEKNL